MSYGKIRPLCVLKIDKIIENTVKIGEKTVIRTQPHPKFEIRNPEKQRVFPLFWRLCCNNGVVRLWQCTGRRGEGVAWKTC